MENKAAYKCTKKNSDSMTKKSNTIPITLQEMHDLQGSISSAIRKYACLIFSSKIDVHYRTNRVQFLLYF